MTADLPSQAALYARIAELEARLEESEETLDAIRRGEVDALVVRGAAQEHRVFTLKSADRSYRLLIEEMQEGAVTLTRDGTLLYCNHRVAELLDHAQERIIGQSFRSFVASGDRARFDGALARAPDETVREEFDLVSALAEPIPVMISLSALHADHTPANDGQSSQPHDAEPSILCGVVTDLRAQKQHISDLARANAELLAEKAERGQVEDALRQAQKMEAVGQLTGGLAHDFSNVLTGISGSLELIGLRVAQGRTGDLERYVVAAQGAVARAGALTRRLLAFSRRETLDPKLVDANGMVAGMAELLQRTVGSAIELRTTLDETLWPTLCDPSQLDNALLNLCINARDAMPHGGTLTIGTRNIVLGEREAGGIGVQPGEYVALHVTDTGVGMAQEVAARAFDPFFTTKPAGQGTGLGLSMIYGFARQSQGQVRIDSTLGRGTTVHIYLPRHAGNDI